VPTDLEKSDALKSPPGLSDPAGAVVTWLEIGQIQGVWTSVTSAHFGGHSMLQIRAFSGVENSIFARDRREHEARSTEKFLNSPTPPTKTSDSCGSRNAHG
jgi:hypothetical protein